MLEVAETTVEIVYSWHNEGKVPHAANCGLEFLGGCSFVQEELADVCCPGNKFVFWEGDHQSSKVGIPTKDDLCFSGSRLCSEFVHCIYALTGRGFFWMILLGKMGITRINR